jgi:hypothetical protein
MGTLALRNMAMRTDIWHLCRIVHASIVGISKTHRYLFEHSLQPFCGVSIEPGSTGNVWQSRFDYTEDLFVVKTVAVLHTADVDN